MCLSACFFSITVQADTQTIITSPPAFQVNAGNTIKFDVNYAASSPDKTTGIGLQLYYDSSQLSLLGLSDVFVTGLLAQSTREDTGNGDNDISTDKLINVAWMALNGNWPATQSGDTKLYSVQFQVKQGLTTSTSINFTGDASAGNTFSASPVSISANNTNANGADSIAADAGQSLASSSAQAGSTESTTTSTTSGGGTLPWYTLLLLLVWFARYKARPQHRI